jgi:hypothetical protein
MHLAFLLMFCVVEHQPQVRIVALIVTILFIALPNIMTLLIESKCYQERLRQSSKVVFSSNKAILTQILPS